VSRLFTIHAMIPCSCMNGSSQTPATSRWMSPKLVGQLLCESQPVPGVPAFSVYISPGQPIPEVGMSSSNIWQPPLRGTILAPEVNESRTGAVMLGSQDGAVAVLPPFRIPESKSYDRWQPDDILAILSREYTIGVVLLRLGRYAVGLFKGSRLVDWKTDTRYVKGRHRAGGTSQKRFERIREGQMRGIFDEACTVVKDKFGALEQEIEFISLGGEKHTLLGFLDRCDFLQRLNSRILPRILDIRVPNLKSLNRVLPKIYESRVISFSYSYSKPFEL
jgi:hypothetical protein